MDRTPAKPEEKLRHLKPAAQAAFHRFQTTREISDLDPVVIAILDDFLPKHSCGPVSTYRGDAKLMADMGFDSLAITEIVFFTEDLFGITISNEEIMRVATLDDLRCFVHLKVVAHLAR